MPSRKSAERDRRLIAAGEPPWGNVLPGTDEVEYFVVDLPTTLLRTVAARGSFYLQRYAGHGRWVTDSQPMDYLMGDPMKGRPIAGREATQVMAFLDSEG
ncbi:MAG: hypothetical protein ABI725_05950 [Chloroflexota bacterium]